MCQSQIWTSDDFLHRNLSKHNKTNPWSIALGLARSQGLSILLEIPAVSWTSPASLTAAGGFWCCREVLCLMSHF